MSAMLRPAELATSALTSWLDAFGISNIEVHDSWITLLAAVEDAERLVCTEFFKFRSRDTGTEIVRTLRYSVPSALHQYVEMIQPTTRFGHMRAQGSTIHDVKVLGDAAPQLRVAAAAAAAAAAALRVNGTNCNNAMTPACLSRLYNITGFTPDANCSGKLGIAGYLEEYAKQADLDLFLEKYVPSAQGAAFEFESVNGGVNAQEDDGNDSVEANLDLQYSLGLAHPIPVAYYGTPGRGPLEPDLSAPNRTVRNSNEPYLDFLFHMMRVPDDELPRTLTTSYGEDEQSLPRNYMRVVCHLFGQLGSRGVSILFASGDSGPGEICLSNDDAGTNKTTRTRFQAVFPASCPWVTAVGGTVDTEPEQAAPFSSGGFSDVFLRPAWQDEAVEEYLAKLGDPFPGLFERRGRGIPDVAAQAANFRVIDKGRAIAVAGTSAATPVFAAIIALLNSARLSGGQPPLGFLNPWLYGAARAGLTDIVHGRSTGCLAQRAQGSTIPGVPGAGWNATDAWDAVTGWGTPVFAKLLELI
ncbi:MAG: vesicle formation at the endoplasmic reticulum [Lichina confinis]|nr:MAG: vesicle formation at the endoplasmic reticulum [Lichina confinis]